VPLKSNRDKPWGYDREKYKKRNNEVELLFRSLKGFRRIFSRFDKLGCGVRLLRPLRAHY
jgi:hypothetical protein